MDTVSPVTTPTQKRRTTTFTVRPELLEQAKALKLNASRAAEAGLEVAIKKALEVAWLRDNAEAIKAHNQRVAERGVLITPIWLRE